MNELDRALEINPAHIDALSAKGALLVKLPSFLGGDSEKGERLLQQVVKQAPKAVNARLALARVGATGSTSGSRLAGIRCVGHRPETQTS